MSAEPRDVFGPPGRIVGMAHRGGAAEATENSPTAFQHAADLGLRWIETDVRASRDGHAYVFHDPTLDRTTTVQGPFAQRTRTDLAGIRLADGSAPMLLAEALRTWPQMCFNIDVKVVAAIGPVLRVIAQADAWDRVCVASFSARRLRELRAQGGPRLATSLSAAEATALVLGRAQVPPGARAAQLPLAARGRRIITPALITRAHAAGLAVHVWTIDDAPTMHELLDLGVDGIITDRPSRLVRVLTDRGQWPPAP